MKKIYELAVKVGSYKAADGENKNRYENVGAIMENDNGKFMFLKRSFNPAGVEYKEGSESIIISMFAPKEKTGNTQKSDMLDWDDLNPAF